MLPDALLPYLNSSDAVLQLDLAELHIACGGEQPLELLTSKHRSFFPGWRSAYLEEVGNYNIPADFDTLVARRSFYLLAHKTDYVGYLELRLQTPTIALIAEIWTPPHARGNPF